MIETVKKNLAIERRKKMKKTLLCALALCTLLTGCRIDTQTPPREEQTPETQPPKETEITTDADDTRLAYYEQLVSQLQQELLDLKTEIYIDRVEYESRIAELEKGSETTPAPEEPPSAPSTELPFAYQIENGGVIITAYTGKQKQVKIPATIEGYPVVAVGDRAFMDNVVLTSVVLPEGVVSIGWFAFSGCVSLENILIPAGVSTISYGAFQNCRATLSITCAAGSYAEAYARSYGMGVKRG